MTVKYGERGRSGEPVGNAGVRQTTGSAQQLPYEETFLAPGTWTWPGNVTHVEVLLVGGGGGGGGQITAPAPVSPTVYSGGGGGGGVRLELSVPVSGPVPVTVGSGGTGGAGGAMGGVGGTTSFGPVSVGGGGGGCSSPAPAPTQPQRNAPPDGGGGGGGNSGTSIATPLSGGTGGTWGMNASVVPNCGGGAGSNGATPGPPAIPGFSSHGRLGYGGGGVTIGTQNIEISAYGVSKTAGANGTANSGAGGNGRYQAGSASGGTGGSGIVIVRWWQ